MKISRWKWLIFICLGCAEEPTSRIATSEARRQCLRATRSNPTPGTNEKPPPEAGAFCVRIFLKLAF